MWFGKPAPANPEPAALREALKTFGATGCAAVDPSASPLLQTAGGCLVILLAIVVQLELFGFLSRRQLLPSAFSRKLTHIGAGTAMTTSVIKVDVAASPAVGNAKSTPSPGAST